MQQAIWTFIDFNIFLIICSYLFSYIICHKVRLIVLNFLLKKNHIIKIILPGSKSLSNRVLLLAALSEGTTIVENLLDSDDIRYMISALKQLKVSSINSNF